MTGSSPRKKEEKPFRQKNLFSYILLNVRMRQLSSVHFFSLWMPVRIVCQSDSFLLLFLFLFLFHLNIQCDLKSAKIKIKAIQTRENIYRKGEKQRRKKCHPTTFSINNNNRGHVCVLCIYTKISKSDDNVDETV